MASAQFFLGIEGGGTRTTAVLADPQMQAVQRAEFGPGNLRLHSAESLNGLFSQISRSFKRPGAVGIGMAGVRDANDRARVRKAAERFWSGLHIAVTNDLEIALEAADISRKGLQMLILSGTGACCFGRAESGKTAKVGGWGHLLGDLGSGYDISMRALRTVVSDYDRKRRWGLLGTRILATVQLNSPEELIAFAQDSEKRTIAELAPVVFDAATGGDPNAKNILNTTLEQLKCDALNCAGRLGPRSESATFVLAGSVLRKQPIFARMLIRKIRHERPNSDFHVLQNEGALGAVRLAMGAGPEGVSVVSRAKPSAARENYSPDFDPASSPTEQRNPRSVNLDRLTTRRAVALMLEADDEIVPALRKVQRSIERAVDRAAAVLKKGGRIFYVGAGTSGRLGVLDASECPPTFRASPHSVQGIIAGGQRAVWQAVEGAEDDWAGGGVAVRSRGVNKNDVVIGIAASGRTPFVWGALEEARKRRIPTVFICFNPMLRINAEHRPDVVIAPDLGPEILTGSTRLKCGTATKLILNMISTLAMVRVGKVVSNLMVDLNPSNVKLRDRAVRIIRELTGCSQSQAQQALVKNDWIVKKAWQQLSRQPADRKRQP